jgi:F0F1-type ATP synthase membrane subunit b/b'
MGLFEMVVAIVFIATVGEVAKAAMSRGPKRSAAAAEKRIGEVETELRAAELRLAQAEERVADLTDKLDFVEQLLADPGRAQRLPPGAAR